ncbi:hypothetical protein DYB30_008063 [Aphanomyces astaci]|uniref:GST N-terminal domain-containing protein n=2 Tax=Aphanomyces astaci TaxID=112090 RepID=A0A397DBI9_APHAT|nr:hypothetical protein DYB30_008063 [Aphanomyces astaci]
MAQHSDFVPTYPSVNYSSLSNDQLDALRAGSTDGVVHIFNNIVCPFGHRALWIALEINAPFQVIEVSLSNQPASYGEKFNRYETVPFLLDNGFPVYESSIVAQYLDSKFNHGNLHQSSDPQAASVVQLATAKFEARPFYVYLQVGGPRAEADVRDVLTELETIYSQHGKEGPYLLGGTLSSAEINLVPFFFRFNVLLKHYRKVDLFADYPRLKAALDAAVVRPAFQQTAREPQYYIDAYAGLVSRAATR